MARLFTAASSEYAAASAAPLGASPSAGTLVAWVRLTAVGASLRRILCLKQTSAVAGRNSFILEMNSTEQVVARAGDGAGSSIATYSATSLTAGAWTHIGAVFESSTSRYAYYNGLASAQNTTSRAPASIDSVCLGMEYQGSTPAAFWDGDIAEAAIYNVALTADEMASLAKGVSPLLIRPANLVAYYPIYGTNSPEIDPVGTYNLTLTGTSKSEHPRIFLPTAKILTFPTAASAGTTVSVPAGSLTLTGYAPTVATTANQTIAVPSGTLTLTGYAPTVLTPRLVEVPSGTLTLTGNNPTVITTSNQVLSIPTGTLILTGYAPTVLGTVVSSNKGSVSGWTESDYKLRQRLRKQALAQAALEDDEEALAILLATLLRR